MAVTLPTLSLNQSKELLFEDTGKHMWPTVVEVFIWHTMSVKFFVNMKSS